ncbi:MAG: serine hydrolase [Candidatus Doudnabacteria bacterium]|nr:serine hydrolase [Candidatus Doudnabacteria bacterium]
MIIYSDNNATAALTDYIGIESVSKIFNDLSLKFNPDQTLTDYISPKEYGLFVRGLLNSTYFNPEMSDRAVGLLGQSDFKEGLAAGLPEKIPVAHKHGELHGFYPNQLKKEVSQLHDCGIIYYPGHPYLLCVMTKGGPDLTPLKSAIRAISQLFYDLMKNVYP